MSQVVHLEISADEIKLIAGEGCCLSFFLDSVTWFPSTDFDLFLYYPPHFSTLG